MISEQRRSDGDLEEIPDFAIEKHSNRSVVVWFKIKLDQGESDKIIDLVEDDQANMQNESIMFDETVELCRFVDMKMQISLLKSPLKSSFIITQKLKSELKDKTAISPYSSIKSIAKLYFDKDKKSIRHKSVIDFSTKKTSVNQYEVETRDISENNTKILYLEIQFDINNIIFSENLTQKVGIINHGVTCYLNSYIQFVFHITAFRGGVLEMKADESVLIEELQDVFFKLSQTELETISLCNLIESFGWNREQILTQQDVQEFSYFFLDLIERESKKQGQDPPLNIRIFGGKLEAFIQCQDIDYRSSRIEEYFDIPINLRDCIDLKSGLELFLKPEELIGDNLYEVEGKGKHPALKGIILEQLPKVLMFNLNRFEFDYEFSENRKVLKEFRFDEELTIMTKNNIEERLKLFAVFIHIGIYADSGHYEVYIKCSDGWFNFNDERVSKSSFEEVMERGFGGWEIITQYDQKSGKVKKRTKNKISHAYMLAYIKESEWHQITQCTLNIKGNSILKSQQISELKSKQLRKHNKKAFIVDLKRFIDNPVSLHGLLYKVCVNDHLRFVRFQENFCYQIEWNAFDDKESFLKRLSLILKRKIENCIFLIFSNRENEFVLADSSNHPLFPIDHLNNIIVIENREIDECDSLFPICLSSFNKEKGLFIGRSLNILSEKDFETYFGYCLSIGLVVLIRGNLVINIEKSDDLKNNLLVNKLNYIYVYHDSMSFESLIKESQLDNSRVDLCLEDEETGRADWIVVDSEGSLADLFSFIRKT